MIIIFYPSKSTVTNRAVSPINFGAALTQTIGSATYVGSITGLYYYTRTMMSQKKKNSFEKNNND